MTLEEAIKHAEEIATNRCDECGEEHRQLAEWLKDYKRLLAKESALSENKGEWVLKQRGKFVDMTCSKCGYVRIKDYAYNYTVEEIEKEFNEDNAKPIFCECCGADMRGE